MYCPVCGRPGSSDSYFCTVCGSALGQQVHSQQGLFEAVGVRWYFLVFIWIILSVVAIVIFDDPFQAMLAGTLLMYGGLALFSAWVISRGKLDLAHLIGNIPGNYNWQPAVLLVIGMLLYSISAEWITHYPIAVTWPEAYQEFLRQPLFLTRQDVSDPVPFNALMVVTLVIAAPVMEEIFFRMLLFPRLSIKWGTTIGILVSSLLFALLHEMAWVGAFVFGVASCTLYMRTRTILVPIAVHALNNAVAALVAWWAIEHGWNTTFEPSALQTELYIAIVLLVISSPIVFGFIGRWWPTGGDTLPYFANQGP